MLGMYSGVRPDVCYVYDGSVTYLERVAEILYHLDGDPGDMADFATIYFEEPDSSGHSGGPFDSRVHSKLSNSHCVLITYSYILMEPSTALLNGIIRNEIPFHCQVNEALREVDEAVGKLMDGLVERELHDCVNVIVVADHGE